MLPLAIPCTLTGSHGKTRRWTSSIVAFTGTDTASRDIPKRSPWISRHSAKSSSLRFESLAFMVRRGSLRPMMSLRRQLGVVMEVQQKKEEHQDSFLHLVREYGVQSRISQL